MSGFAWKILSLKILAMNPSVHAVIMGHVCQTVILIVANVRITGLEKTAKNTILANMDPILAKTEQFAKIRTGKRNANVLKVTLGHFAKNLSASQIHVAQEFAVLMMDKRHVTVRQVIISEIPAN